MDRPSAADIEYEQENYQRQTIHKSSSRLTILSEVAASASKVTYPALPAIPTKMRSPLRAISNGAYPSSLTVTSPPNISRQRSTGLASLKVTPPRTSYSQQMAGIFKHSDQRHMSNGRMVEGQRPIIKHSRISFGPSCDSDSDEGEEEDPLDDLERAAMLSSSPPPPAASSTPPPPPMPEDQARPPLASPSKPSGSDSDDKEDPLGGFLRAPFLSSSPPPETWTFLWRYKNQVVARPPPKDPTTVNVSSQPSPLKTTVAPPPCNDNSSEEWTGDEDFFPRSARRRLRLQRLLTKRDSVVEVPKPLAPRERLGCSVSVERGAPLCSPKPSRFQDKGAQQYPRESSSFCSRTG